MTIYHTPKNTERLEQLYAWVSVDDGGEGIVAGNVPGFGWTPLVTGSYENALRMGKAAKQVEQATGKRIRLLKFTGRIEVYPAGEIGDRNVRP